MDARARVRRLAVDRPRMVFVAVFAVGAWLRFAQLGRLPSPAGDEGTWTLLALRLARGEHAGLPADAAFVSTLFAWLVAGSFRLLGASFATARLVCASASLATVFAAYVLIRRLGSSRGALGAATLLALHPWCIAWGRTASVPYALALFTMTAGPLAFLLGLRERRDGWIGAGVVLVGMGAQFSPLTLAAALACALVATTRAHRHVVTRPMLWGAIALVGAATWPLLRAADRARAVVPSEPAASPADGLPRMLHTMATGLSGEATLRHFTGAAISPRVAIVTAVPFVLLVAMAARTRRAVLHGFGPLQFGLALLVVPLLLAPARAWQLDAIDADRYLFALVPALAFCLADVADRGRRASVVVVASLAVLVCADVRGIGWTLRAGGPDTGVRIADGGGAYRGWRASTRDEAVADTVARAIRDDARGARCDVLVRDWAFHPLRFALDGTTARLRDVRAPTSQTVPARLSYVVLWDQAVFADRDAENTALRVLLETRFTVRRRILRLVQPDGRGLLEVWRAEALARDDARALRSTTTP